MRRYDEAPPFQLYPFGALVFVKPHLQELKSEGKFRPKMLPHLLVGVGTGPGGKWDKTYKIVSLAKMLGDKRASRANVKRSTDVMFPEVPSYPLKLKITASGALGDLALPGPKLSDD